MAGVIRQAVRAWVVAGVALTLAGAGLVSLTAGSLVTSPLRMGLAAAVLSAYTAAVALVATDRPQRTLLRCLVWGGTVPLLVGLVNALLVASAAGGVTALLTALPWLAGPLVALTGRWLPGVRIPDAFRRSSRAPKNPTPY